MRKELRVPNARYQDQGCSLTTRAELNASELDGFCMALYIEKNGSYELTSILNGWLATEENLKYAAELMFSAFEHQVCIREGYHEDTYGECHVDPVEIMLIVGGNPPKTLTLKKIKRLVKKRKLMTTVLEMLDHERLWDRIKT